MKKSTVVELINFAAWILLIPGVGFLFSGFSGKLLGFIFPLLSLAVIIIIKLKEKEVSVDSSGKGVKKEYNLSVIAIVGLVILLLVDLFIEMTLITAVMGH